MSPQHGIHRTRGALPLLLGFPDSSFVLCSFTQAGPGLDLALCVWDYPLPLGVWSGMPSNMWEGGDEQRCGSHLGDGYFVGVKMPCPGLTLCFLEAVSGSGCSTAPRGDQHMLSPLPQLSPGGNCISPAATCAGGGFIAPLRGGALGTLHCFNPPLCLA